MATFLAIFSALGGVLVGNFKEEITNFFLSSRKYRFLKGKWACKWVEFASPFAENGKKFFDQLVITRINGRLITGQGDAKKAGEWSFKGKISQNTVTLLYTVKKGDDKSGVIILKIDLDNPNKLEGVWSQYKKGHIVTGTTSWDKSK